MAGLGFHERVFSVKLDTTRKLSRIAPDSCLHFSLGGDPLCTA
ncbi:Hypothetical protein A7982_07741 [Minicystis rosea]|nr:Hypothetical protein A7982_07741 [Minicystis rosea]